jgi:hypothetical protein
MRKNMSIMRSEIVVPLLAIFAILLAAIAIFQPWWSMNTSPELQMIANYTMSLNAGLFRTLHVATTNITDGTTSALAFGLTNTTAYQDPIFQTITASRTDGNLTTTVTFNIVNVAASQVPKQIANATNLTLAMLATGLVLTIVMMLLILMITVRKMPLERYAYLIGIVATIILLVAPLQMSLNITGFSGSSVLNDKTSVWNGETLAAWGPSTGWFLALAAALMTIVCLLPIRMIYADRRRGIVRLQSLK